MTLKYSQTVKYVVLITLLLTAKIVGAQSNYPCGAVEIQKTLFKKDRKWFENQERTEAIIQRNSKFRSGSRSQGILTIPVVVHVVHNYGAENISDQQIFQAIQNLNDAFAHKGYYSGKGNGHDTQIQFCLANRTPSNQGTTGINRVASTLTNMTMETDDISLKDLSRWNPLEYVNIWIVNEINSNSQGSGVAGYAYLAGQHGQPHDGMVCEAKYFGVSPSDDVVFIHEMGHYLNLLHTFDGGCTNDHCEIDGDKVCDTPPDQSLHSACVFNSCDTDAKDTGTDNPFTTDVNDMTENYMDYSPFECQFAFTKGQSDRMRATLEGVRMSLLESQGCLSPCPNPLMGVVNLPLEGVTGQSISFSYTGTDATNFEWKINDTMISTQNNYNHTFTKPGVYKIELIVNNQDPNCLKKLYQTIRIICNIAADFDPKVTNIKEGTQVTFTSNTTGATDYVWKIDGIEVGNNPVLNHTFDKTKDFLVQLIASNPYCSHSKSGKVSVESACGDSILIKKYITDKSWGLSVNSIGLDGSIVTSFMNRENNFLRLILYTNSKGEKIWSKSIYKEDYFRIEPVILTDGNILLCSTIKVNNFSRMFLTKLNKSGDIIWTKIFMNDLNSNVFRIGSLSDGGFCIATVGQFYRLDKEGNVIWSYKLFDKGIRAWVESTEGNIMMLIDKDQLTDVVILLDASGNIIQQNEIFGKFNVNYLNNTSTKDGGFLIIGNFWETHGQVLLKFDDTANLLWAKKLGVQNYVNVVSNKNGDILLSTQDLMGKITFNILNENGIVKSSYITSNRYNLSETLFVWSNQNKNWVSFEGSLNSNEIKMISISPNLKESTCLMEIINVVKLEDVALDIIKNTSNFLVTNSNIIITDHILEFKEYDIIESSDCRIPNPCPKNCNQDLVHKKMVTENDVNISFLNQTSYDEVLINGVFLNPNNQYGTFYGGISKNNQNNWMKAIKGQSFNLVKIVKNEDFYYLIGWNIISKLIIQKIDLNGNIIWNKSFNQIEKSHLIHDCKIINNIIYFGLEVQSKVVGESKQVFAIGTNGKLLWLKKLNNTFLQCSTVGIDGIWLVSQVESTKLLICKLDFYGNIVLEKYYETNSTIKFMYNPCTKSDGGLLLKFGFSISDILLLSTDIFADIIFTKKIIGDVHSTSNISENNGYIFYCHHQDIPSPTFNVLDKSGNVIYTKRIDGVFNEPRVSNYNNGWVAACVFQNYEQLIYFFPESQDDCILQSTDPIQVIDYQITTTSGSILLEDIIPSQAIDISAIESEEMFVSFDALCTVNAPCIEICDNGIDDDDNGLTDCADTACPCNVCENKANISIQSIDQIQCEGDTYVVNVTVCNIGEKTINPNTPITFYNNDPWTTNAQPISSSQYFINGIDIDSCVTQEFELQKFTQGKIYAVVNATMDFATPFTSQTIFPTEDCDMTNNTLSFEYHPFSPALDLGPDVEICYGQSVLLSAQEGFEHYSWQDFYPDRNYTAITAGRYTITVVDVCGDTQTDDIEIRLKPLVAIDLGTDITICKGDTITIGLIAPDSRDYLWDDGLPGVERTVNKAGVYTLGAYSDEICVVKDTITVTEVDRPALDMEDQKTLCEGDTFKISLPVVPGISYLWNDNNTSLERTFSQEGIFIVTASNAYCSTIDSLVIKITEKPEISLPNEIKKCVGDTIMIGVSPSQGLIYEWNNGRTSSEINVYQPGNYTLTASENGCENMASIEVIDISKPIIQLGDDINACEGDTISLSVPIEPNITYLWNNGLTNPAITVNESGNFILEAKNENCISKDSINVTFLSLPISSLQDTVSACQGQMIILSIAEIPQNKAVKWSDGTTGFNKEVAESGTYKVEISNELCIVLDSVNVTFLPIPDSIDLGGDTTICEGEVYNITLPAAQDHKYLWDDGNANPSRGLTKNGDYKLVVTNKYGCNVSDSITLSITEMPYFDLGVDQKICLGDSILLNPDIPFGATIMWDDKSNNEMRFIDQQGIYSAILTYDACQIKDSISILIEDCNPFDIHFPNVFRYNSAENGIFKPVINGDPQSITKYSMLIFDRWGNVVFKSSEPEDGWNGTFSGHASESGVYVYTLDILYSHQGQANQVKKQGSVTLLK